MASNLVTFLRIVTTSLIIIAASGSKEANAKTKQMVEEAGCPFVSPKQLLVRNVCLLPDYQTNELPNYKEGKTNVEITIHKAFVLEVEEMRNRITFKIVQFMQWCDPRIKTNYSAIGDPSGMIWLTQKNIAKIWHPELDMYTEDLEEWKSLYDPSLYRKVVVLPSFDVDNVVDYIKEGDDDQEEPYDYNDKRIEDTITHLGALKAWRATIHCIFDFSLYPLDTQHCTFVQFGINGMNITLQSSGSTLQRKQEAGGFHVSIENIGNFDTESIGFNVTLHRIVQPYIYQYYLPCIAIVVVSQVSFIIPLSAIPGRVALVATQFLTLTNIFIHQIVSNQPLLIINNGVFNQSIVINSVLYMHLI